MSIVSDTYAALKPTVDHMYSLMKYIYSTTHRIGETLEKICTHLIAFEDFVYVPSVPFLLKMAKVFSLILDIDAVKNFKGSINNDFSFLKRYS